MIIHVVKPGETLTGIANEYNVNLNNFLADNGLNTNSRAVIGQALVILQPETQYIVQQGDTLTGIANRYNVSIKTLLRNNYFLKGSTNISPGQTIVIKYQDENRTTSFITNGYAYPFISRELLREQLPYMTYSTPFTYGIREDGGLVNLENDEWMIAMANSFGTKNLMHLSTLTEAGNFSNERANLVFTNENIQSKLINETIGNMERKGYDGLDIDFEFIYPEDRYDYVIFLQNMYKAINPLGYPLFSALAPKVSDTQQGTLYEGHDYGAIASSVDKVLLMTYEWGYTYGPPMAEAPINKVNEVVEYALTRISSSKILLGVPTYGYDWPLPFEQGVTKATSLSPVECIRIAEANNAEIQFDTVAQSPWFRYTDNEGRLHEVWFEDPRSITAKLQLAERYNLSGIGYWNLMREFPQNLVILNANYNIITL